MRQFSLDKLRTTLKKADERSSRSNFQSNYYPYYQLKPGESAKVRFLPDLNEDNPYDFFVEKYMHPLEIDGEERKIPCLTMYSTDKDVCPICNLSRRLYKAGDKATGKIYWKRMSRIAQVLVVDDPLAVDEETGENFVGKVKLLNIGFQLFNVIREGLGSEEFDADDDVPFAFKGGRDFIIKKTEGQGGYATYTVGSKFTRKPTDIDEELVLEHMVELATVLPNKPDIKEIEKVLKAAQSGVPLDEDEDEDDAVEVETLKSGRATSKKSKAVKPDEDVVEEVEEDEDDNLDDEEEVILEQIRLRRNAKK